MKSHTFAVFAGATMKSFGLTSVEMKETRKDGTYDLVIVEDRCTNIYKMRG